MTDCRHRCCPIPENPCHTHLRPPWGCPLCHEAGDDHDVLLGRVVADVVARIAPQIGGLPSGDELTMLVRERARAVLVDAGRDPDVVALGERERRRVLAARVGIALAFPPRPSRRYPTTDAMRRRWLDRR